MRAVINWALWVGGGSKNSGVRIAGGDGDAHGVSRFEALARNKVKPKSGRRNWVGLVNDMSRFEALARNKVKSPNRKWKLGGGSQWYVKVRGTCQEQSQAREQKMKTGQGQSIVFKTKTKTEQVQAIAR